MNSRLKLGLALIFWSATTSLSAQKRVELLKDDVVPGIEWQKAIPESLGYSSKKLEVLRQWVSTQDTMSMTVIVQGRVIFSYGDVTHPTKIASVRKSVLSMLYGRYVEDGTIDLDKTVKQLGLDDRQPFLPIEETATLRQLLAARSGVYLPTSSFGQMSYLPPRGSEAPGAHYLYSNWDFNAAGAAFEKLLARVSTMPYNVIWPSPCYAGLCTFQAGENQILRQSGRSMSCAFPHGTWPILVQGVRRPVKLHSMISMVMNSFCGDNCDL